MLYSITSRMMTSSLSILGDLIMKYEFRIFDCIPCVVLNTKKMDDLIVRRVCDTRFVNGVLQKDNVQYVVERDGTYSHGETVSEAIEVLKYKLFDRDTCKFEGEE